MTDPLIPPEGTTDEFAMTDSLIPPEATIRVWTCECGKYGTMRFGLHFRPNSGQVCDLEARTERVYVAVDREAWVERVARVLDPVHRRPLATDEALARAVVDAILGPEDRDA